MRIPRVFIDAPLQASHVLELDEARSRYLLKVLRLKKGFRLILFNGDGQDYPATISDNSSRQVRVQLGLPSDKEPLPALHIHLALSLSKGDRFDTALQKATELGVSEITPLITEHNAVRLDEDKLGKKLAHWHSIIESACEQSGRSYLPRLHNVQSLVEWQAYPQQSLRLILHPDSKQTLKALEANRSIVLLVGPEGGLSDNEVAMAVNRGFQTVRFGSHILRTETAAMAAIAAVQTLWGW